MWSENRGECGEMMLHRMRTDRGTATFKPTLTTANQHGQKGRAQIDRDIIGIFSQRHYQRPGPGQARILVFVDQATKIGARL